MNKSEIKMFFWNNKEGLIIGGVVGYLIGKFFLPSQIDTSSILQTQGVIDVIQVGTKSTIELVKTKVIYASTIIGAVIGMIIDDRLPERWWK